MTKPHRRAPILLAVDDLHELVDEAMEGHESSGVKALHEGIDAALVDIVLDDDIETIEHLAAVIDAAVALDVLIPVLGPLLEQFDGLVILKALTWLQGLIKPDPVRRARKKAARQKRRAARRERRG